jgi:hypothetical protein
LFAAAVSDAEDDAEDLLRAALRLRSQVRAARGTARLALAAAYLMPTRMAEQRAARAEAIAAAKQRIASCNEALDILAAMIKRLEYALRGCAASRPNSARRTSRSTT